MKTILQSALMTFISAAALIYVSFHLVACVSAPPQEDVSSRMDPVQTIKHELTVEVNGQRYDGLGVLPVANIYHIKVYADEEISRIVWTTCHQQWIVDQPEHGWFDNNYTFNFKPMPGIETASSCALEISVLTKDVNVNQALFEFKDEREEVSLMGHQKCNGWSGPNRGVGICQSAAGLLEEISFDEAVLVPKVAGCDVLTSTDNIHYQYKTAPGECAYYFTAQTKSKNGKRLLFRLRTLGYTKAL